MPKCLNRIFRQYQIYYHEVFYYGFSETQAASKLLQQLKNLLKITNADESELVDQLVSVFANHGYHALFGKTQGYYGPYIWQETLTTTYTVQLPTTTIDTVNLLKGMIFRSWMAYMTFDCFGTKGWAGSDGNINCIVQANDLNSEQFLV